MKKEAGFENRNPFVELGLVISVLRKAKGYTQYNSKRGHKSAVLILVLLKLLIYLPNFLLEVFFNIADILEVKPGDLLNLNLPSSYFNKDEEEKKLEDK